MAKGIGRELAHDLVAREAFMIELMIARDQQRAFACGMGLAEGATDLNEIWALLLSDFEKADVAIRNVTVLGGFLGRSRDLNPGFAQRALDDAMRNSSLIQALPYLQARVGIDELGVERLRRAIAADLVEARGFLDLANGVVEHSPPESLARLLADLAGLPDGGVVALDILHMYIYANKCTAATAPAPLLGVGRQLLCQLNPARLSDYRAYGIAHVIRACCSGDSGKATAIAFANVLRANLEAGNIHYYEVSEIAKALGEVQPHVILDIFLLKPPGEDAMWRWDLGGRKGLPYKSMSTIAIQSWVDVAPEERYALLGPAMSLFSSGDFEEGAQIDQQFINLLRLAPNKTAFLGSFDRHVHPMSFRGSFKAALESRRAELARLAKEMPGEVANWVNQGLPKLNCWIANAEEMDRDQEESFE